MIRKTIGNVIFVQFTNPDHLLTKGDLDRIEKRIDAINEAIALCSDDGRDDDVLANLEAELEMHIKDLERSLHSSKKRKQGK